MLGISFTEFIVIVCVAMIFIKPEDIPLVVKTTKVVLKKILILKKEYSHTIDQLQKDLDLEEEDLDPKIILDENGKPHIAYNVEDLKADLLEEKEKHRMN